MDPSASAAGCACPECYGLAEFMLERTGRTYGLPLAPGHGPPIPKAKPEPEPEPPPVRRPVAAQPWEPRPSRHRLR